MPTVIARNLKTLKKALESPKFFNKKIGLVPTMGAIHEGHLELINKSLKVSEVTVVSIFLNPIQFSKKEDLNNYPKTESHDIKVLTKKNVDLIFIPNQKDMYPPDFSTYIYLKKFNNILCGKRRKEHFSGVSTVVLKLFSLVKPTAAFFGEKDYQQLVIIKKLVKDLNFSIKIYSIKTVRDKRGLALSSRNKLLSEEEKIKASKINSTLNKISINAINNNKETFSDIKKILNSHGINKIEYLEIRDETFLELFNSEYKNIRKYRVFLAVKIGKVRLIDNIRLNN